MVDSLTTQGPLRVLCRRQPWGYADQLIESSVPPGAELVFLERDCTPESQRAQLREADVLMGSWLDGWPFVASDFTAGSRLRLIQLLSAGYDPVDLSGPLAAGIPVANIGDANASTVAEQAVLLMLALLRQLRAHVELVRSGGWRPAPAPSEARNRTLGIIGLGRIGREIARRAQAFDMQICYHNRHRLDNADEDRLGARYLSLPDLLADSDVVIVAASGTGSGRPILGPAELQLMKPESLLVNVARGSLVDEAALVQALDADGLAGAALDVLEKEPPEAGSPLVSHPRVLVTPHQAGISPDVWPRVVAVAWRNVELVSGGQPVLHRVA